MSKFDIAADGSLGQPKHRYELEIEGQRIRIHSTMLMGHHTHLFKQQDGVDSCELTGSYQITIMVGKLFSAEAMKTRVTKIMDELMAPPPPRKKKEPVKKIKKVSFNYDDEDDEEEPADEDDDFFDLASRMLADDRERAREQRNRARRVRRSGRTSRGGT